MSKISNTLKDLVGNVGSRDENNQAEEDARLSTLAKSSEIIARENHTAQILLGSETDLSSETSATEEIDQPAIDENNAIAEPSKTFSASKEEIASEPGANGVNRLTFGDTMVDDSVDIIRDRVQEAVEIALQEAIGNAKSTVNQVIFQAIENANEFSMSETKSKASFKEQQPISGGRVSRPHAFVIMPFGKKTGLDGTLIDFNAIYQDLIKPALEEAGFEAFRADEETTTGDILTDMFQELLLADLAICDLSIDNANVFYELGIRHAFRKRGIVHIQSGRAYMPFDIFNVRTIPYHTNEDGAPDPVHREKDIQAIARVCRDTWASDQEAIHSPVFNLLTGLNEPERRDLRTPLATGFWREYNEWRQRVAIAQRQKRIGDIMLLTEEISNPFIREEAISEAGRALKHMNRHELALQQYRQGLKLNSKNVEFRREEALHLNRLGRLDEAIIKLENLLQDHPNDWESTAYLGRIYKDMWSATWEKIEDPEQRIREAYEANHWLIKSIRTYLKGYYTDLNNYYPGINALTLSIILDHLANQFEDTDDPDVNEILNLLPDLKGTLQFSLEKLSMDDAADYWTLVSLAELVTMTADSPKYVKRAYKKALTAARKNIYNLQTSIEQLEMLNALQLCPEFIEIGAQVLKDEIRRITKEKPEEEFEAKDHQESDEQYVFLFTGHRVDKKGTVLKRFPEELEAEARKRIDATLKKYQAGENDLALTAGAACGGEIIFIEACLDRNMKVEIHLPKAEPEYIKGNISQAGDTWVERYYNLRNHPNVTLRLQEDHIGKVKPGNDPEERNNRWALYSSLVEGISNVRLIALWDGQSGASQDKDGLLVSHMVEEMRRLGGYVEHINTTKFDYWQAGGKIGKALDEPVEL